MSIEAGRELDAMVAGKTCTKCGEILPSTDFTRNSRAPDGLEWNCKACLLEQRRKYYLSDVGRERKRAWHDANRDKMNERRRALRELRFGSDPQKIRARGLVGNAVRRGYMSPPNKHHWKNRWEFHHVDYSRPYYGVWVRKSDHDAIDHGFKPCPQCNDYSEQVRLAVLKDWGLG
jgi:hypothetical protein